MLKKVLSILIVLVILLGLTGNVNAAELKTTLKVVESESETKYLENDQGYFSKKIVDSNADTGEVTVDLSLSNIANSESTEEQYENTEIFIIVDEELSGNTEKLNQYISYIDTLAGKVFEKNSNTKIGIIGMKGTIIDVEADSAKPGANDERTVKGTESNAEILVNLTSDTEELKTGLQNMNTDKKVYRANFQAAIRLANKSYSNNVNKLLISLYDGVPDIAIGISAEINGTTQDDVKAKHEDIATNTRSEILALKNNNVKFVVLRPDDTSYDKNYFNVSTGELVFTFDGSPYVQKIYGTLENPTHGKMYSLSNESLDKIITENIYKDVIESIGIDIKSAVIKEYFSKEIVENFDITFVNENVDTTNLAKNNYVVWEAGDIPANKNATLQYKLKIKDMKNEELLDKVISISEKTELTYINNLDTETTVESTSSPKIKLSEVKEELNATVSYDPTAYTTEKVTATIKTDRKVNEVEGWKLSEDGMTLTKEYTINTAETVHLVSVDGLECDVLVNVTNIIKEEPINPPTDDSKAPGTLPQTGVSGIVIISVIGIVIISLIAYKKYYNYKDIK